MGGTVTAFRYPETLADRIREHAAADETREAWRVGVHVRPKDGSRIDWELFDGLEGEAEFKTRFCTWGQYPDVLACFADKWDALLSLSCPAFVVIRFNDGLRWAYAHPNSLSRIALGGREDRPGYIRPSAYLRNDALFPIERRP